MKTKHILGILTMQIIIAIILYGCKKDEETAPEDNTQFTDSRDSKTYQTIQIGDQWWMAENLNYDAGSGSWVYDNNSSNAATYGRLYDWETACDVCPDGWHLPSDAEWQKLVDYLGGENIAGGKMKETGTTHWQSPNTGATNESGFSALPGGNRSIYGTFTDMGIDAIFWSSTEGSSTTAWYLGLNCGISLAARYHFFKIYGNSVRCVKD